MSASYTPMMRPLYNEVYTKEENCKDIMGGVIQKSECTLQVLQLFLSHLPEIMITLPPPRPSATKCSRQPSNLIPEWILKQYQIHVIRAYFPSIFMNIIKVDLNVEMKIIFLG